MTEKHSGRSRHRPPGGPHHASRYVMAAAIRLSLGWVFLWAFLDKTFGLGHGTAGKDAWVNGGSPTAGFLGFATAGPFSGAYHQIAGQAWADWLFMLGLLGIGTALMLGVAMRLATAAGVLLLVLMWWQSSSRQQPLHGRPPDLRDDPGPDARHSAPGTPWASDTAGTSFPWCAAGPGSAELARARRGPI